MASEGVQMPGGMGGLMRYDEEFKSKLSMSPAQVVGFIAIIILFVVALKIFWPVG
ncbi:MAG: preprotein translocase subunit Sec61beta [Candidatus Pacearchaeota archaeon]